MTHLSQSCVRRPKWTLQWLCLALSFAIPLCLPAMAAAANFEFKAPLNVDDPKLDLVMRDLAERILPVYEESDPERYLESVSALQLVAGWHAAAAESRRQLSERLRAEHGSRLSRAAVYDLYAQAKTAQSDDRTSFDVAFNKTFREYVPKLEDSAAYTLLNWLRISPAGYRLALQHALDRQRLKTSVNDADAIRLMWTYLSYAVYRDMSSVVGPLAAEDDRRRFLFDDEVTLKAPNGDSLTVVVVRPRSAAALPALLEYSLRGSTSYAKECASQGYVGVIAYTRVTGGAKRFVPFQYDGKAATTVINWIAAQPWSDGQVGMFGTAYSGFAAWAAAKNRPAALKAIATIAPTVPGIDFPMQGNIFHNSAFRWSLAVSDQSANVSTTFDQVPSEDRRWKSLDEKWYRSGKAYRQLGRISRTPNFLFIRWLNHPSYDRYWQHMIPFKNEFAAINIPTLTITGYYAASEPGALYYFNEHTKYNAAADDTLVIGPYDDSRLTGNISGLHGLRIAPIAEVDLRDLRYGWFNSILKGAARPPIIQQGRVNMQIAETDEWTHAASIDAIATASRRLYLVAEREDGGYRLSPDRSAHAKPILQKMDLKDRSDFNWRPNGNFETKMPEVHNGLVFASRPFTEPVDVAGVLSGGLDLVTNKMDLDITMTLYERTQQGDYILLTSPGHGFRASYAHDRIHRRLLQAGPRQRIHFMSDRLLGRRLKAGSRLVLVLGLNKRADQEINYGSDTDVSAASRADANGPVSVQWLNDSYIEIPIHR
jgi:putative CocE/NonD family hydrolase